MKKLSYLLLFISCFQLYSQQTDQRISISYEDASLKEIILQIEDLSKNRFYFVESWLDNKKRSGSYTDITLEELLDTLFDNTLLNYYITEQGWVILLRNNAIYDSLPQGFFGRSPAIETVTTDEADVIRAPIFYNEAKSSGQVKTETIRIGKESDNRTENRFVLSGTIRNANDGTPAGNVILRVLGKGIGTVTNDLGEYSLRLPVGENQIRISSLGYEKIEKKVIIYNDGTLDINLSEAFEGLDEVLITGNVDNNVQDTKMGTTNLDVEKIKNIPLVLGERDIFRAAATLPGISNAGEGASGYNVRGGKTDQNLILLDDGVIYNPAHFFGIFSAINPFTTGDVTIYKGHVPSQFGGRLSSVFDITTKDANLQKFSGEASIGPVTSNLVLETPLKKDESAIMVGGRSTYSDIILRNLEQEELRNSEASFYDVVAKFTQRFGDKGKLKATAYYSRDAFSITSDSLYRYTNRMISAKYEHRFSEKQGVEFSLANSRYGFDIEFDGQANNDFELGYVISETELKVQFQTKLNNKHNISYGLAGKLYNSEPGNINPLNNSSIITPFSLDGERALEGAVFISDLYEFNERLSVEAGVRFSGFAALGSGFQNVYQQGLPKGDGTIIETREYSENEFIELYGAPEFRLATRYLLKPDLSVKASFNTNFQYIHTLSNNTTVSPIDTWKLSDLNIKPQNALHYSLGFYKNLKDNMYEISIEGYYKKINNILDYKVGAQLLLNEKLEQQVLQGEGKAYGVEFLVRKSKGRFNGWLGYTYSRSFVKLDSEFLEERVNNGEFFPANYDKPHDFSAVANFKITERFSFSGNFVYQTGRPVTVPVGTFIVNNTELVLFSDRNEFRIPDYYRLDLSFNVEGNHKLKKLAHSFWNISVYNVLGRNNPYSVFFVNEDGEIKAFKSSIFALPIPTISYNLKF